MAKGDQQLAHEIAKQLNERHVAPRKTIERVVRLCGAEFAQSLLEEVQEIEANGGMMVKDGSRRRTPGGVFFYLVRGRVSPDLVKQIFYPPKRSFRKRPPKKEQQSTQNKPKGQSASKGAKNSETASASLDHLEEMTWKPPPDAPPEVAAKLEQLHSAATTYRRKIATLEAQGQETGLKMTRKLLASTEQQIEALEGRYSA